MGGGGGRGSSSGDDDCGSRGGGFSDDGDDDDRGGGLGSTAPLRSSSGRGILEFSPDKAGRDVTPANYDFQEAAGSRSPTSDGRRHRNGTLNSIAGRSERWTSVEWSRWSLGSCRTSFLVRFVRFIPLHDGHRTKLRSFKVKHACSMQDFFF